MTVSLSLSQALGQAPLHYAVFYSLHGVICNSRGSGMPVMSRS